MPDNLHRNAVERTGPLPQITPSRRSSETLPMGFYKIASSQPPAAPSKSLHRLSKSIPDLRANPPTGSISTNRVHRRASSGSLKTWLADQYDGSPFGLPLGQGSRDISTQALETPPYAVNQTKPLTASPDRSAAPSPVPATSTFRQRLESKGGEFSLFGSKKSSKPSK